MDFHFVTSGDPSCDGFWDIVPKIQIDKHSVENPTNATAVGVDNNNVLEGP